jgi:hypothetical protein
MALRAPASPAFATGWLHGWRFTFAGGDAGVDGVSGAMATVVEEPGESVFVVLYDVPPADEQSLDVWEDLDLGMWRKIRVRVDTLDGDVLAWLYVLDAYEGGLPTQDQLALMADAATAGGAPMDYVARLLSHPCQPPLE